MILIILLLIRLSLFFVAFLFTFPDTYAGINKSDDCSKQFSASSEAEASDIIYLNAPELSFKVKEWLDFSNWTKRKLLKVLRVFQDQEYLVEFDGGQSGYIVQVQSTGTKGYPPNNILLTIDDLTATSRISFKNVSTANWSKIRVLSRAAKPEKSIFLWRLPLEQALLKTRIPAEDIEFMNKHGAQFMNLYDFLLLEEEYSREKNQQTILLGNDDFVFKQMLQNRSFINFRSLYSKYYNDGTLEDSTGPWSSDTGPDPSVTHDFMLNVVKNRIVFLVPNNFERQRHRFGENKPGYTYAEWEWLKSHFRFVEGAIFIVGAEDTFGPSNIFSAQYSGAAGLLRQQDIKDAFVDPSNFLMAP